MGQEEAKQSQLALISGQLVAFFFYIRVYIILGERMAVWDSVEVCGALVDCPKQVVKHTQMSKQTATWDVEQRQVEFFRWVVFCISMKAHSWNEMTNVAECSFKIASWYGDIFGTLWCALRHGWHGRRERSGFAEKEIEKKLNTRSQISWNNSCDRNGKRQGSRETKNDFSSWLTEKEKDEDKYIRAIINVPLCRQFNSHTVQLEANIASVKLLLGAGVGLSEWKSWTWISLTTVKHTAGLSLRSLSWIFYRDFSPSLCVCAKWEIKQSNAYWIRSMCTWPFIVTCQGFCAKKGTNYKPVLLSSAGPSGHSSKACWLELSALLASYSKHTHTDSTQAQVVKLTL